MEKAYLCPEGHSLLVDENITMNGRCPICHTDYPLYLLTPARKKKAETPKEKEAPKAIAAGEKSVELPATASTAQQKAKKTPSKAAPKKAAAKKTTPKKATAKKTTAKSANSKADNKKKSVSATNSPKKTTVAKTDKTS